MEQYADIGNIRIYTDGRIYNISKSKFVHITKNKSTGYSTVSVGGANHYVHRLVAQAFIPNPDGKEEVNHIDGDKDNNFYTNLEWVSSTENKAHAVETGLATNNTDRQRKSRSKTGKVTAKRLSETYTVITEQPVEITNNVTGESKTFVSGAEASRYYNHGISWARGVINHPTKMYRGKYLDIKPWNKDNIPGNSDKFVVTDKSNNQVHVFKSAVGADAYFNKSHGYFSKIAKNGGHNGYWEVRYE